MIRLASIDSSGRAADVDVPLDGIAEGACRAMAALYGEVGYTEPWIGYLAVDGDRPIGSCAFKSAPVDGRVEIAYFTFPPFEGRGHATGMAAALLARAREAAPDVTVVARTLPDRNASHRVLEKLGFRRGGLVSDPEDGLVLEWVHAAGPDARPSPPRGPAEIRF